MIFSAHHLAQLLEADLHGNPDKEVLKPAKIEEAGSTDISFLANPKYERFLPQSEAGILIVSPSIDRSQNSAVTYLVVADPYLAFTRVLTLFSQAGATRSGIENPSFISEKAQLGADVYVGAFSYVSEGAIIGNGVKIYPGCYIGEFAVIDDGSVLMPGVRILSFCAVGKNCLLHSGVVIGSDGFGFAPQADGSFQKIPQTGNVIIEDEVEIGANTVVDRATLGSTIIRKGAKIDNLVQIAHNAEVGRHTAIAAQAGISGSTKIGNHCLIGGQAGFVGHIEIADQTRVNAQSGVAKSIKKSGEAVTGSPAFNYQEALRAQVVFRQLPELAAEIRRLKQLYEELKNS